MKWTPFTYTFKELFNDTKYIVVWPTRRWLFTHNFNSFPIRIFVLDIRRFRRYFRQILLLGGQIKGLGGPPKKNDSRENPVHILCPLSQLLMFLLQISSRVQRQQMDWEQMRCDCWPHNNSSRCSSLSTTAAPPPRSKMHQLMRVSLPSLQTLVYNRSVKY